MAQRAVALLRDRAKLGAHRFVSLGPYLATFTEEARELARFTQAQSRIVDAIDMRMQRVPHRLAHAAPR